jgi:coenzyme Q-binding protein COQ10
MQHHESRLLPFDRAFIYDLVADVERYPEFVPAWREARVVRRDGDSYWTDQVIGRGPLARRFRTRTSGTPPERIEVTAEERVFRRFTLSWRFDEPAPGHCMVAFSVVVEARSRLLQQLLGLVMAELAHGTLQAFEDRARLLWRQQVR